MVCSMLEHLELLESIQGHPNHGVFLESVRHSRLPSLWLSLAVSQRASKYPTHQGTCQNMLET